MLRLPSDWSSAHAPFTAILAEGTDPSGWVRDRRTYLHGDTVDATLPVDRGMAMRITDRGIDGLEGFILTQFTPETIEQMLLDTNPLYSGMGVTITGDAASVGSLEMDLDAQTTGLALNATIYEVSLDVTVDAGILGTYSGTIWLDAIEVTGTVVLSVDPHGDLLVEIPDISVNLVGLQLDFPDIWEPVLVTLEIVVPLFLEGTIADMLASEVITAVEDALGAVDEGFAFGPVTIHVSIDEITHDVDGVNIVLDLVVAVDGVDLPSERVGSTGDLPLMFGAYTPIGALPYGAQLVIDDDALNAIGIGLFASGELEQVIEGELPLKSPMPLEAFWFMDALPSMAGVLSDDALITLITRPSVPMVGTAVEGPEGVLDFHIPGFMLEIHADLEDLNGETEPAYLLALDAPIEMTVDAEAGELVVSSGDDIAATLLWCDPVFECESTEGESLSALMKTVINMFVSDMLPDLTALIDGVVMVPLEGGACGIEADHASFYADLVPAEPAE